MGRGSLRLRRAMTSPAPRQHPLRLQRYFHVDNGNAGVTQYSSAGVGTVGAGSKEVYEHTSNRSNQDGHAGYPTIRRRRSMCGSTPRSTASWQFNDYTYTEFTSGTPVKAVMTYSRTGHHPHRLQRCFHVDSRSAGYSVRACRLGTSAPGSTEVFSGARWPLRPKTVTGIPTTGATLYVRLYS